jgi:aspartyl-tRNA(Asn)/glutamyl-tRNA(Gln) amidotransferase subunit A
MKPIADLAQALEEGTATSRALVESCLEKIYDSAGEGRRVYISLDPDRVRSEADRIDAARREGLAPSPLAGIPVSVKALFDVAGSITTAGSKVLADAPPAANDAEAVRRLRDAGLIVLGQTNMTEFAYSGLGLNPHFGTPRNPFDRMEGRAPGGSSSGAAVSVADSMAAAGLGTDTGGSCRIPAAFCNLVGFKPTASRVPLRGTFPLSSSLDSIGPIARTVDCCARIDAILSGDHTPWLPLENLRGVRLGVLRNYVLDDLTPDVAWAFGQAIRHLEASGATVSDVEIPDLARIPQMNANGGIVGAEAFWAHRERMRERGEEYDPRVLVRIHKAGGVTQPEYEDLLMKRQELIRSAAIQTADVDFVIMPTTPMQAPTLKELEDDTAYGRLNLLALRNPTVANVLDRCAITVPMRTANGLPAGCMLMGPHLDDRRLLSVAAAAEKFLSAA